jgi:hypothetical protein
MADVLTLNRERRRILAAAGRGRVTRGATGVGIYLRGSGTGGTSGRCDGAVKQLLDAGWVRLGADGSTYEPTDTGRQMLGERSEG